MGLGGYMSLCRISRIYSLLVILFWISDISRIFINNWINEWMIFLLPDVDNFKAVDNDQSIDITQSVSLAINTILIMGL